VKITKSQLKQIINEELDTVVSERKKEEQIEDVDPAILEEMKDIMSVIAELREAHGRTTTGRFQYSGGEKEIWIDDLYRLFKERLFRVEKGYLARPPSGVQMSTGRIVGRMVGNMSYWLQDLVKSTGRAASEFPRLMAGFAGLAGKWDAMFKEGIDHRLLEDEEVELNKIEKEEKAKKRLTRSLRQILQIAPPSSFSIVSNLGENGDNIFRDMIESISEAVNHDEVEDVLETLRMINRDFQTEPSFSSERIAWKKMKQFKTMTAAATSKYYNAIEMIRRAEEAATEQTPPKNQARAAMAFLDEILMKVRSPILHDVYLRDLEGIVQDLRLWLGNVDKELGRVMQTRNERKKVKLTKSQLKQIIKEELTDEDVKFLMNGLQPVFSKMEEHGKDLDKVKGAVHQLYQRSDRLNGDVQNLEGSILTINDKLSIKPPTPSRFGDDSPEENTNAGGIPANEGINLTKSQLKKIVEEVFEETKKKRNDQVKKV